MSFLDLKNRGSSGIANYGKMLESIDNKSKFKDARIWELTKDSNMKGEAVIRFLPEAEGNDSAIVKGKSHSFKNPVNGRWFVEQCPQTIGGKCPVCEKFFAMKKALGENPSKAEQEEVNNFRAKDDYYANIYVVNDIGNPANNGKVFVYRFGFSIWTKIKNAIAPDSKIEQPKDVFNMWEGYNFLLKIAKLNKPIATYDNSAFTDKVALGKSDEERQEIYKSMFDLRDFISGSKIKTYKELEEKMLDVLGNDMPATEEKKEVVSRGSEAQTSRIETKEEKKEVEIDDSIPYDKMSGSEVEVAEDDSADEIMKNFLK